MNMMIVCLMKNHNIMTMNIKRFILHCLCILSFIACPTCYADIDNFSVTAQDKEYQAAKLKLARAQEDVRKAEMRTRKIDDKIKELREKARSETDSILKQYGYQPQTQSKIMLFGGNNHSVYLGCLNCWEVESDSVFNNVGKYGSDISSTSIFNMIGQYGSEISNDSPCNNIATNPPVIVDDHGNFYGDLTINLTDRRITQSDEILSWLKKSVCKTE